MNHNDIARVTRDIDREARKQARITRLRAQWAEANERAQRSKSDEAFRGFVRDMGVITAHLRKLGVNP